MTTARSRRVILRGLLTAPLLAPVAVRAAGWEVGPGPELRGGAEVLRLAAIEPAAADPAAFEAALRALVGAETGIEPTEPLTRDRLGRVRAQLRRKDGVWLQQALVADGHALVAPEPGHEAALPALLAAEAQARDAKRGAWGRADPPLMTIESAELGIGRYAIVEATVLDVLRRDTEIFLDTGPDWRSDFTVRIAAFELRRWRAVKRDPLALAQRRIRARGWLFWSAGPMIDVVVPEQVEVVA